MAEEKTDEKVEYFRILDLSKEERSLRNWDTNQKIADHIGTSTNSLQKWRENRGSGGGNGQFDLQTFLTDNKKVLADALLLAAKNPRTNATALKLFAQLTGDLVEKKEETVKVEYSSGEIARDAGQIIEYFRERLSEAGVCPVCQRPIVLLKEVCAN